MLKIENAVPETIPGLGTINFEGVTNWENDLNLPSSVIVKCSFVDGTGLTNEQLDSFGDEIGELLQRYSEVEKLVSFYDRYQPTQNLFK